MVKLDEKRRIRHNMHMHTAKCSECGLVWLDEINCQDRFHQMLYWEAEDPHLWEVHHLMVLCFHLQHPSLISQKGLEEAKKLLAAFVEKGIQPQQIRDMNRVRLDSGKRDWKIHGSPDSPGSYGKPVRWTMNIENIIEGGEKDYIENIRRWAQSVHESLMDICTQAG
jgi:hypothetical protein